MSQITTVDYVVMAIYFAVVLGMGASGATYGLATAHFYWIGAIPAMVFVGILRCSRAASRCTRSA
jgi:hypothetical protein